MKIIVGLGNPGKKYELTRHNVGFFSLDKIIEKIPNTPILRCPNRRATEGRQYPTSNQYPISNTQLIQPFKQEKKFKAEVAKFKLGEEEVLLVKPQTFMNLSGEAVKAIVDFYKINTSSDLIIVHDEIDLPVGSARIRFKGSSAGHKGIQSIIDGLGTESFMRVRIGIGRPQNENIKIEDWVLQKLSEDEIKAINDVFEGLIKQGIGYLEF